MIWLLGGYMWLYVHRPFEVWPALGALQIERGYMLIVMLVWLVYPNKGYTHNAIHLAIATFSGVILTTWLLSPYSSKPGCLDVVENYAKVAVFYILVVTTVRDDRSLRLLILMFLGAVGVYVLHSFREYLGGRYQWRMGTSRMIGVDTTFGDPNVFASTMLYTLSFVLPFWNERPRRIPKWMMVGYILLLVGCILLTGSRAAFMGLCLLGFMLLVSSMKRKLQAMLLGAVVAFVGFVVLTVALPEDLQNRYLTILDSSRGPANAQTSAQGRIDGIMWGFYLFGQSPFNGYGPGSFVYCTGKGLQPHNLYGQVLSEMGLLGGLALIGLLLCYWRNVREVRRLAETGASKPSMSFALQVTRAAGFNLVLLLALGCGGHNLYRYNWQWFAAFTAIAVCCARKQTATAETWEYAGHAPRPQFA